MIDLYSPIAAIAAPYPSVVSHFPPDLNSPESLYTLAFVKRTVNVEMLYEL